MTDSDSVNGAPGVSGSPGAHLNGKSVKLVCTGGRTHPEKMLMRVTFHDDAAGQWIEWPQTFATLDRGREKVTAWCPRCNPPRNWVFKHERLVPQLVRVLEQRHAAGVSRPVDLSLIG